jgi:hypothetical protein
MLEVHECEECRKPIGPDDAYVGIDIAVEVPDAPLRAVRLHPDHCLAKFLLKHPLAGRPERATKRKKK